MLKCGLKTILTRFTILLTLLIISVTAIFSYVIFRFDQIISTKLDSKKILRPTEFYAAPQSFNVHHQLDAQTVSSILLDQKYRKRTVDQRLFPGDFVEASPEECRSKFEIELTENETHCFALINRSVKLEDLEKNIQFILVDNNARLITRTFSSENFSVSTPVLLESQLIAQFRGNLPTLQKEVTLSEIPPLCLQAVMAIEDDKFLDHSGVSYTGIFRALFKNIISGKKAQGGSTITQQLVKNYFLTNERSYRRKIQEILMAIVLESKFSKDQIFETYLNVIYMGQNGPFSIHGYSSAAQYYFNKEIGELNLSKCATLAAILNGPTYFNPFKNPEPTLKRRAIVLDRMTELKYISKEEADQAKSEPLPKETKLLASETAPYYLDAVRKQMNHLGLPIEGVKIFTALNLAEQQNGQEALRRQLTRLESENKYIKSLKQKKLNLEGVVLSGDPYTGLVSVVVGGRSFRMTQFNRAIDGHRQVGSIMKPFVYLAALIDDNTEHHPFLPWTLLSDKKFISKYENQSWSPDNYGNKYFGEVPMFYALKNSLNAATANLGLKIGLEKVIDVAHALGVQSELKPLPSLSLGSFELYPIEVLQAYMTISQMGLPIKPSFIRKVTNEVDQDIYIDPSLESHRNPLRSQNPVIDQKATASLVSMMKQTVISGSARMIPLNGFTHPTAGKTGTTSDNKDAWFVGFTPYKTTLVWVGYDDNTAHKLTGASGAVPIWLDFMKSSGTLFPPDDFSWPEETEKIILDDKQLEQLNAIQSPEDSTTVELIVPKGTAVNLETANTEEK